MKLNIIASDGYSGEAILKKEAKYGRGGCEGVVFPTILSINGKETPVQVKHFYKESFDDRGDHFTQDPNEKARESFEAFTELREMGFKTVPYFALGKKEKDYDVLIMTDLTQGGGIEVYDQKQLHRNEKVRKKVMKCKNWKDIRLGLMKTDLLKAANNVGLGYGVCHMFTRNPRTNRAEIFVTDVGEYRRNNRYDGEVAKIISRDDFVKTDPSSAYSLMLNDDVLTKEMIEELREKNPTKHEFMELVRNACIYMAFTDLWGGWWKDAEWAKKIFTKNGFNDKFMKIKLNLKHIKDEYDHITGEELYHWDGDSKEQFSEALKTAKRRDLLKGLDISYQACIDSDLFYFSSMENEGFLLNRFPIVFDNSLPVLMFLDDYFEGKKECEITVHGRRYFTNDEFRIKIRTDIDSAYDHEISAGTNMPPFLPEQILEVRKNGKPLDTEKLEVRTGKLLNYTLFYCIGDYTLFYCIGDDIIHYQRFNTEKEMKARLGKPLSSKNV